jgi:hypothetical protein
MKSDNEPTDEEFWGGTVKNTNSSDWLAGYHQALEDIAKFIEDDGPVTRQAEHCSRSNKDYAEAIRAMKEKGL